MSSASDEPALEAVRTAAADWFARMHGLDAAAAAEEFERWRSADPAHDRAYRQLLRRWDQSKFLQQSATARNRDLSGVAVWHRRPVTRKAAAGVAALLIVGTAALGYRELARPADRPRMVALVTRLGEVRTVSLEDGSRVTLDSATSVQITFTRTARSARLLDGAARFDISRDSTRSFAVATAQGSVTASDAQFDISQTRGLLKVTALRGRLAFTQYQPRPGLGSPASRWLDPGHRVTVSASTGQSRLTAAPVADQRWVSGMMSFDGERLGDAVEEINRHNSRKIVLVDPSIADRRISGAFHADDVPGFARAIARMLHLDLRDVAGGSIELAVKK